MSNASDMGVFATSCLLLFPAAVSDVQVIAVAAVNGHDITSAEFCRSLSEHRVAGFSEFNRRYGCGSKGDSLELLLD